MATVQQTAGFFASRGYAIHQKKRSHAFCFSASCILPLSSSHTSLRPYVSQTSLRANATHLRSERRRFRVSVFCEALQGSDSKENTSQGPESRDSFVVTPAANPATANEAEPSASGSAGADVGRPRKRRQADTTDLIASSLTRRFGLAGGLVWLGFLSFGAISEQLKTRKEVADAERGTIEVAEVREVLRPNGARYADLKVGGGAPAGRGDLVLVSVVGRVMSEGGSASFVGGEWGAEGSGRPIAFILGGRAVVTGLCQGVEEELLTMRAGGKRRIVVPPELGFGNDGMTFANGVVVPPNAFLEYVLELQRVSIPPS